MFINTDNNRNILSDPSEELYNLYKRNLFHSFPVSINMCLWSHLHCHNYVTKKKERELWMEIGNVCRQIWNIPSRIDFKTQFLWQDVYVMLDITDLEICIFIY